MQSTSLIQQQKLQTKLSPTQIQVIRMLELTSMELPQRINEELQENPALEEGSDNTNEEYTQDDYNGIEDDYTEEREDLAQDPLQNEDFNYDEYVNDDETPDYMLRANNSSSDAEPRDLAFTGSTSFTDELKAQIYLTKMTKPQRHIAKWVLGNIDDDGYLRRTVEQLVDDYTFQEGQSVSDEEMADIVRQIKQFDPPGVAAANLQECLLTQLQRKPSTPAIELAIKILEKHFEAFSKHHFDRIMQRLDISEAQFKAAVDEILRLNQKPANTFTGNVYDTQRATIIPDFYVENREGELVLTLNTGDIPELHVSREYSEMLDRYAGSKQTAETKEAMRFIRNKLDSARWFIDAIRQRNETLTRTMTAIMQFQRDFFIEGDETYLRPMILQDIADRTGYDVSTISRVSNSKYVQTQFGIFPLKYFFSESMTNTQGEEVSTREIKHILQEVISKEDKQAPYNDDKLVELLSARGYVIARRTIAKYREQLGIPVARLRRTLTD
ncbi:MAG: RNA polymerase factor sigma-54 [Paludibacteraceae bacterium]